MITHGAIGYLKKLSEMDVADAKKAAREAGARQVAQPLQ
jgi:hypothetical protein